MNSAPAESESLVPCCTCGSDVDLECRPDGQCLACEDEGRTVRGDLRFDAAISNWRGDR